jgi:UDP-3-O-[3-hydroxymyristoyl] N-acetylglucosamine deacetylase
MSHMTDQRTLKQEIRAKSVGLQTGGEVSLTIRPAPVDTGIVFRRIDLDPVVGIKAVPKRGDDAMVSTTIQSNSTSVSRINNLMSAFTKSSVDNAWVDLTAEEIPIMDGTDEPFDFLIRSAGIEEQDS